MSCDDCVFLDNQKREHIAIPCNSCQGDSSDKGYCVAARTSFGYTPIITKIFDRSRAADIMRRANRCGSEVELLLWSSQINAFCKAPD